VIVVRNVFHLNFGQAKTAVSLWKEGVATARLKGHLTGDVRILTDVVGQSYTLVVETTHGSLAEFEESSQVIMKDSDWQVWYPKFVPLAQSGYREILKVVE